MAQPTSIDESKLRHPWENTVFVASVLLNILIFLAALWFVNYGGEWLKEHPLLGKRVQELKALAFAAVLAVPALPLIRNLRRAHVRGHSVQLSPRQLPQIHEILVRQCARLGMPVPELYLSDDAIHDDARAYTAWKTSYLVLDTEYIDRVLADSREVIAFLLGRELGRIRLHQAAWWDEILLAYVVKAPILRRPLRRIRAYSRDRYGAVLAPEGIKGILVCAAGRRVLPDVNIPVYMEELQQHEGFWDRISELVAEEPHVTNRIRALIKAGLAHA